MTVYNFNLGIGWASSGVEYAQAYRAKLIRDLNIKAKFIFTDMFDKNNMELYTKNIGFLDEEVIWLYQYFTDFETGPCTFTLTDLENTFSEPIVNSKRMDDVFQYRFDGNNNFVSAYLVEKGSGYVQRVETVRNGCLIRTDHYTSGKLFSEYFAPLNDKAHLYLRRFFNKDGSIAYEEYIDDESVMYHFKDKVFYSKIQFFEYFLECLHFTKKDVIIADRTTLIGQSILMHSKPARVGIVVHADHFNEGKTDDDNILWNNYYEYTFSSHEHIDFYIVSTKEQNKLLAQQFKKYENASPKIYTIPVGGLEELKVPEKERSPYSLITASRLASEKHIDWVINAVALAHKTIPQITLDVYGYGGEMNNLSKLIKELKAEDYIKLCGQQKLDDVYMKYEAYISGSTSEGFGLSLLEAVGSGLPIVGFNVRYGNPTFIHDSKNGYLIPYDKEEPVSKHVDDLANTLIKLFKESSLENFHQHSYSIGKKYLAEEVTKQWKKLLTQGLF